MKNKKMIKVSVALFAASIGVGFAGIPTINQKTSVVEANASTDFVNKMSDSVQNTARKNNLYSSVTLAQMILESSYGKSELATKANNYFGIKGSYYGATYSKKSLEYDSKGKPYYAVSKFKKYPSVQASIDDYANHMRNGVTWDHKYYSGVWRENAKNYQAATKALNAKYSTNGIYATHLNKLITTYHLDKLDVSYSKVSYRDGTGSETAKVVGNGYNLYNHVSNTAGSASKGSASQLAGKEVYMDCTANKDNQSTWYRIRVAGSNTKYWVDGRALQLRKIDYVALPANATMTFNG
ncbi:glucosaminidase domain-containing protein, partial [Dellaglioa carnosa]